MEVSGKALRYVKDVSQAARVGLSPSTLKAVFEVWYVVFAAHNDIFAVANICRERKILRTQIREGLGRPFYVKQSQRYL